MEYALAIQELFPALSKRYETAEQLMSTCGERYAVPISRLYLGASFCGRLFNVMAVPFPELEKRVRRLLFL